MKIILKNIGSISTASIEISNLTVISGENDSGKTTISKVIYALGQAMRTFKYDLQQDQKFEINKSYKQLYMYMTHFLDDTALFFIGNNKDSDQSFESRIARHSLMDFLDHLKRNNDYIYEPNIYEEQLSRIEMLLKKSDVKSSLQSKIIKNIEVLITSIRVKQNELLSPTKNSALVHKALKNEFSNEIVKVGNKTAELCLLNADGTKIFSMTFNNEKVITHEDNEDIKINDSTLVEGPSIFQISSLLEKDEFRDKRVFRERTRNRSYIPYHMIDLSSKITGTRDVLRDMLDNPGFDNNVWDLSDFYDGSISYEDSKELFRLSKKGKFYLENNISSGIKALAIIDLLIKGNYITKKSILILDEPETNLHPTWQKKYAKAIIKMVDKGAKILVNTHSPYMLEALKLYSDMGYSESTTNKFYFASKNDESSLFTDTNGDISIIIKALSAPLYDLIEEAQGDIYEF